MAASGQTATGSGRHRRGVWRFIAAGITILLLAQILNGVLTLSAIRNTAFKGLETATRIVGHDWAFRIQNALRFGKPLTQMFGLPEMLAGIRSDLPFLSGVVVTLPDGTLIEANLDGSLPAGDRGGSVPAGLGPAVAAALNVPPASKAAPVSRDQIPLFTAELRGLHLFILPISGRDQALAGTLTFLVPQSSIDQATRQPLQTNLIYLAATTSCGALALAVAIALMIRHRLASGDQRRLKSQALPLVVLVLTQGCYSWGNIQTFRAEYVESAQLNAARSVDRFGADLERLVAKGVQLDRLGGLEAPFGRMMADIPELDSLRLEAADGRLYAGFGPDHRLSQTLSPPPEDAPQSAYVIKGGDGAAVGRLVATLSPAAIASGVRQRVLDAGTVVLTSALFVIELMILLTVLMRAFMQDLPAKTAAPRADDDDRHHLLARPAAFILLFAWALPISFVPLRMGVLYQPFLGLSRDIVLALPISAEMLCALFTALAAGWLTDRKGWHVPFLAGGLVCALGAVASALATGVISYIAARGLVGLGYGLAWMGIQGFVFTWAGGKNRTQAIANLVAGIFAGHICGSATGGMLADQLGYGTVFLFAAVVGLAPGLFGLLFMRRYFGRPAVPVTAAAPTPAPLAGASLGQLGRDRNFLALLAFSVVPFSVAQVGLLYYTLPVYLSQQGVEQSNIGRIMMLYGLSVIYLGPLLGRWVDRHAAKKPFIVCGGLIGGAGLAFIYFDAGLAVLVASVFLLGLASSLGGPAQSSFALRLPTVQRVGTGRAMGVQRAADKLGQMLGPLAVGALFAAVGTRTGLAITGAYYLASTLLFLLLAKDRATSHQASSTDAGR